MLFKKQYFKIRNQGLLDDDKKNSITRKDLARRELETFEILCRIKEITWTRDTSTFLDLGSGDQFLRHAVGDMNYIPLDIDDVDFDSGAFPVANNSVDILFSLAVIEHINNIDHFMSECYRVLKPGGIIYVSTPNFRYYFRDFYNDPTHVRPFTDISLPKTLEFYGFKNVEAFPSARCKADWFYKGKYRFAKCAYLPFLGTNKWAPSFLSGRSTGVICLGLKPMTSS